MSALCDACNCQTPFQTVPASTTIKTRQSDNKPIVTTIGNKAAEQIETGVLMRPTLSDPGDDGDSLPRKRRQIPQEQFSWWRKELFSWMMSLVCLACVVGTLIAYQNKEIPKWHHGITLNTIIAVVATMETLFLEAPIASSIGQLKWNWFDRDHPLLDFVTIEEASQGPIGSLKLVFRRVGGSFSIFGALLLVAILSIPPFLQQVISYEGTSVRIGHSSISTRRWFSPEATAAPYDLKMTLYGALAGFKIATPTIHSCASGNCTWSEYESLAICGRCHNATNLLDQSGYLPDGYFGIDLKNYNKLNKRKCHPARLIYESVISARELGYTKEQLPFSSNDMANAILHSRVVSLTNNSVKAEECILSFCTATFNATARNGHLVETRIGETWPWSTKISLVNNWAQLKKIRPPRPRFLINRTSVSLLREALFAKFNGAVFDCRYFGKRRIYEWYPSFEETVPPTKHQITMGEAFSSDSIGMTENIWNKYGAAPKGTLEALFRDAAEHATTLLRNPAEAFKGYSLRGYDLRGREYFNETGKAFQDKTLVRARWGWIGLPIALEILALGFLIIVMTDTHRRKLIGWRGENVFSLFQGPGEELREYVRGINDVKSLEKYAGVINVRLRETEKGWRLSQSDEIKQDTEVS